MGERSELTTYYNPQTKEVYIGSQKIAVLTIYGTLNPEETDGYTHTEEISAVLYNPLFKRIVTCGFESTIITWDPFTGFVIYYILLLMPWLFTCFEYKLSRVKRDLNTFLTKLQY